MMTETSSNLTPPPATALSQAVLVLGMHRSGTSAISRVLNLMGVDLGKDLMPPAPDNNETGFWEHRILQWINRRTFESIGREWDTVLALADQWWKEPQIEDLRTELQQAIQHEFAESKLWGSKDPRLCFLMPMWRTLLEGMNCETRCVLIFRNPIEVARSLEKRDRIPASQSYLMWLRSLIEAERGSRGLLRTLATYESLLADWKGLVGRIGRDLKMDWPVTVEDATPAVEAFLRPSLRHHQVENDRLLNDERIPELVRRAYRAVLKAAESGNAEELSETADSIAGELDENHPMLVQFIADAEQRHHVMMAEKQDETKQLKAELVAVRATLSGEQAALLATKDELQNEQAMLAAERAALASSEQLAAALKIQQEDLEGAMAALREQLGAKLSDRDQTIAQLNGRIAEQDDLIVQLNIRIVHLDASVVQLNKEIDQLRAGIAHLHNEVSDRVAVIGQRDSTIDGINRELAVKRIELDGYQQQRQILREVVEKVWASRSWRWTGALRSMQKKSLTVHELIAATPMTMVGPHRWQSEGPAHFIVPCLPVWGRIRIRLKMKSSIPSVALLFFDTGRFFNDGQHFNLGNVEGELVVDQVHVLEEPVYCFRFDAGQSASEFDIEQFEIVPLRSFLRKSKA